MYLWGKRNVPAEVEKVEVKLIGKFTGQNLAEGRKGARGNLHKGKYFLRHKRKKRDRNEFPGGRRLRLLSPNAVDANAIPRLQHKARRHHNNVKTSTT